MKSISKSTIVILIAIFLFIVSALLAVFDVSGWGWFLFVGIMSFLFYVTEA